MRSWIIIIGCTLAISLLGYYRWHPLAAKVRIRGEIIYVDVAVTQEQKHKGLGGRAFLEPNRGMLFSYDHKEQYNFWMRGMLIPLDFVWIDGKRVMDITEAVPPPTGNAAPNIVKSRVEVDKILELHAGAVKRLGIQIGDTVEFLDR